MPRLLLIENSIKNFVKKHCFAFFVVIVVLLRVFFSWKLRGFTSADYTIFLDNWIGYIRTHGGILALKDSFANYNQPYLILLAIFSYLPIKALSIVKIISLLFDFILAFSVQHLVKTLMRKSTNERKVFKMRAIAFLLTLVAPTIFLNSACWGQCDCIYSAFVTLSLSYLLRNKYPRAFFFFGLAFAFKLQALFIFPLFIILYLRKKNISLLHFLIIPAVFIITSLPSLIVGLKIDRLFMVYIEQINGDRLTTLNLYNFYTFLPNNYSSMAAIGYLLLITSLGILSIFAIRAEHLNKEGILKLGLTILVTCTFFLPQLHERYLYLAAPLSIALFTYGLSIGKKNLKYAFIPISIEIVSLMGYLPFLFQYKTNETKTIGAICYAGIFCWLYYQSLYKFLSIKNNRPKSKLKQLD